MELWYEFPTSLGPQCASFLVSDSPIASTSRLPPVHTFIISPNVHPKSAVDLSMELEPLTERETLLMAALNDSYQYNIRQKEIMIGMQAQSLLQASYVENVRIQLQTQEEKKDGGKRKGCINMDGKAKILTQDDIFKAVVEGQTARDAAKDALLKRKDAKERYSDAVGVWKVREMDRREKNTLDKEGWKTEVKKWEVERDSTKYDKRKPRWQKPKMPPMEKATIKPKLSDFVEVDDNVNEEDENSDLDGSDSD